MTSLKVLLFLVLTSGVNCLSKSVWQKKVMLSIRDGSMDELGDLIEQSPGEPTQLLAEGFCNTLTPLQFAAKTNFKTVPMLIERGADPRQPHSGTQTTPLMFAARSGEIETVMFLLAILNEADINAVDEHGSTALTLCSLSCQSEIATLLIKAGANLFQTDKSGNNALHIGAFYCGEGVADTGKSFAEALLQSATHTPDDINRLSTVGRTALMLAGKQGGIGFASVLLNAGADKSIISPADQKTYLDFLEDRKKLFGGEL